MLYGFKCSVLIVCPLLYGLDDDIPPLEDLSEEITKRFNIKQKTKTSFLEVDSDYEIQKRREKQMKDLIVTQVIIMLRNHEK